MKKPTRPPRFLPEVIQAIYELRENGGSNSNKIVSHVKSALNNTNSRPRNISTQVRRALKHAATNGIVKQRAGKFRINADVLDPYRDCAECRRRKKMRRRKKRYRKHPLYPPVRSRSLRSDSEGRYHRHRRSDSESDDIPVREVRRRRRKGRRKRRGRTRPMGGDPLGAERPDRIDNDLAKDIIYPDDHREDDGGGMHDDRQCDNPECLCNVKEEIEEMQQYDPPI
jgi:hypothetical protein